MLSLNKAPELTAKGVDGGPQVRLLMAVKEHWCPKPWQLVTPTAETVICSDSFQDEASTVPKALGLQPQCCFQRQH